MVIEVEELNGLIVGIFERWVASLVVEDVIIPYFLDIPQTKWKKSGPANSVIKGGLAQGFSNAFPVSWREVVEVDIRVSIVFLDQIHPDKSGGIELKQEAVDVFQRVITNMAEEINGNAPIGHGGSGREALMMDQLEEKFDLIGNFGVSYPTTGIWSVVRIILFSEMWEKHFLQVKIPLPFKSHRRVSIFNLWFGKKLFLIL